MSEDKTIIFDGSKATPISQVPESWWSDLQQIGAGNDSNAARKAFQSVAWLSRAVTLRSDAISNLPFRIMDKNGKVIDTSKDYQNALKFFPDIKAQLKLIEASLVLTGTAYQHLGKNRFNMLSIRYLSPLSIAPEYNQTSGELTRFKRNAINASGDLTEEDIIYFWLPDAFVERGVPGQSPVTSALAAAGVLMSIDEFAKKYFERGAVKPTILSVKGGSKRDQKALQIWWKRVFTGLANAWASRVVQGESVTATVIGDGIESLKSKEVTDSRREDISTALGVPQSKLFPNAANYATKQSDNVDFITDTIAPEAGYIQEIWNTQLFNRLDARIQFYPEELSVMQAEENDRSASLVNMVTAGVPLPLAMQMLGYDLPEGMDYETFRDYLIANPPPVAAPAAFTPGAPDESKRLGSPARLQKILDEMPEDLKGDMIITPEDLTKIMQRPWADVLQGQEPPPDDDKGGVATDIKMPTLQEPAHMTEEPEPMSSYISPQDKTRRDLNRWRHKSLRLLKNNKPLEMFTYESGDTEHISGALRFDVFGALGYARTEGEINDIFSDAKGDTFKGVLQLAELRKGYDQMRNLARAAVDDED